jgi:hypothetical protein
MFARNDNSTYEFYKCTVIRVIEYKYKNKQGTEKTL